MENKLGFSRDFKGVWIPKEIYLDRDLDATEKILYAEIDSLDKEDGEGCYASNEYLANFCMCRKSKVSSGISKWIEKNYIYLEKFDGRRRWLKVTKNKEQNGNEDCKGEASHDYDGRLPENGRQKSFSCKPESHKNEEIYNSNSNINNNTTNNIDQKVSDKSEIDYKVSGQNEPEIRTDKLPYNYTKEQIASFIKEKITSLMNKLYHEPDVEDCQKISKVISFFYECYYKNMGKRHPIMSDEAYIRIINKMLNPIDAIYELDVVMDVDSYEAMIEQFFLTTYGVKSGNNTDYRIGYFFSDKVLENLAHRSLK